MASLNIDNLITTASRIRYADTEGENTAERVGALFVDILSKIKEVVDAEELQTLELKGLIQGTSGSSNSRLDPFKLLGYPESYESLGKGYGSYEEFNDALDGLLYDANVSPGQNYGYFRARVLWRDVEIKNILLSSSQRNMIQVISGTLKVNSDGLVIADDWVYRVLWRQHTNSDGWSTWKEYGGTSSGGSGGEVSPELEAQVNENTANIAQNTSDIERLMKKNFPIAVSLSVSKSVANILAPNGAYTFSWSIKKGNDKVTPSELSLTVNGKAIESVSTNDTSYTYIYNSGGNVSPSLSASLVVKIDGITHSGSTSVNFVYPSHIGVVDGDFDVNDTDTEKVKNAIRGLSMDISSSCSRTYIVPVAEAPQKVVYAYPKSFGALSSIKDGNNLDMFNDFTCEEKNVYGNINHYVYTLNNATTNKGTVTIKFS